MSDAQEDVMALAGLRRLVLHSRDKLRAVTLHPPQSDWSYHNQRWTGPEIRQYGAMTLADHVMTLVVDCLPSSDGVTADEATELRASAESMAKQRDDWSAKYAAAERTAQALREEVAGLESVFDERSEALGMDENEERPYEIILDDVLIERDELRDRVSALEAQLQAHTQNRGAS